jgi:hypothetical protein
MKSLPCQPQLNANRRAACDFLLEKESNTIANALQTVTAQRLAPKKGKDLSEINVKTTDFGRFDG